MNAERGALSRPKADGQVELDGRGNRNFLFGRRTVFGGSELRGELRAMGPNSRGGVNHPTPQYMCACMSQCIDNAHAYDVHTLSACCHLAQAF